MAWGLDDLAKLVNGLRNTFDGGRPSQVGNRNVQDSIVKPGRILADASGVSQGYKGAGPNASIMDRSMALLALAGMLGGQEAAMGLKGVLTPEYAYGLHINPSNASVGKKIKPILNAESRYGKGATPMMNAFFGFGKTPSDIPEQALSSSLKWAYNNPDGSASIVKTPLKNIAKDSRSSVGWKTPKNLKVVNNMPFNLSDVDESAYDILGDDEILLTKRLLESFINKTKKATP